jgi:hypothetical protein
MRSSDLVGLGLTSEQHLRITSLADLAAKLLTRHIIIMPMEFGSASMNDNLVDEALEFLDKSFEDACCAEPSGDSTAQGTDEAVVQELFIQIAAEYAGPLKHFITELGRGTATADGLEICRPILQSLIGAAGSVALQEAALRMTAFDAALGQAQREPRGLADRKTRDHILANYQNLKDTLPEIFELDDQDQKRDEVVVRFVLKQIPRLDRTNLTRLYQAGLGSLSALLAANAEDLAAATSIPRKLCERICGKLDEYRAAMESIPRDRGQPGFQSCLASLVRELRHQEEEVQRTSPRRNSKLALETERRQRLHLRQRYSLQIIAILAGLGELELIQKIQKLSFKRRIRRLEKYLETSRPQNACSGTNLDRYGRKSDCKEQQGGDAK